jgi:hypothetical protein
LRYPKEHRMGGGSVFNLREYSKSGVGKIRIKKDEE